MEPDSNQPSRTSGVRFITPPQEQVNTTASRYSLCRSVIFFPPRASISSIDPATSRFLQKTHSHTGIGVAQYRFLEMFQSRAFSSHLPKRPYLIISGYQEISWLLSINWSLIFSTARYQASS